MTVVSARDSIMFDRITFDPRIMGGRACIRGMRITVAMHDSPSVIIFRLHDEPPGSL